MQRMIRSIFVLFLLGFFTVTSAQLPPEIRADAYLLQAEQAIRNGDTFRAQAAIQNILEGVLKDQPVRNENSSSVATPLQTQDGQAQDSMQQALQNLENVCGEKYQNNFSDIDHGRFYCLAAFNYYCGLKRAQSSEEINALRASLEQVCTVLKRDGLDSKCSYCK